jgi:hypothetical protein
MEKNQPENIDKLFQDALGNFKDRPGGEVWEKIAQELDEDKRRAYVPLFRSLSLIAASLLVLGVATAILFHTQHKNELAHASRPVPPLPPSALLPRTAAISQPPSTSIPPSTSTPPPTSQRASLSRQLDVNAAMPAISAPGYARLAPAQLKTPPAIEGIPSLLASHANGIKKNNLIHLAPTLHRWSITGYFSQELAGYNLADHDSLGARGKEVDKKQTSLSSASAGVLVGYELTKKWLLQTGFVFSWSRSLMNPSTAYAVTDNNGNIKYQLNTISGYGYLSSSSATGDSVKTGQSSSRLHYLSIPIIASYTFRAGRFGFLAGAGVMGNFLTGATVQSRIEGTPASQPESIVTLYGLRKVNYGLLFKTEAQFAIRANWSLNLMLTSKNTLTAINTNTHYSTYPYYIGLGLGLKHSF